MKRSNPSDDPSNPRKKAKLTDENTVPNVEANDVSPIEEISTFCDLVPYPPSLKVRGKDFEFPVHGVFLFVKSKSLQGILCQPGNSQERIWILDEKITRASATQFLSHFYPNIEPKFDGFDLQDFLGYQTLIDMHLGDENGAILEVLKTKIDHIIGIGSRKYFEQSSDDDKKQMVSLLDFVCKKSIVLHTTTWAILYRDAMKMESHLDWCHFSYFLDHCLIPFLQSQNKAANAWIVVLFYIALKNDIPFDSLDLTKIDPPDDLDLKKAVSVFRSRILNSGFDKAKANDMFVKAIMWLAKLK